MQLHGVLPHPSALCISAASHAANACDLPAAPTPAPQDLLQPATDPTTRVRAAELLCNLARGGTPSAPSYPASPPLATVLRQAGFVPVLLGLADPALVRRAPPEVVAPALLALAAMALGDVEAAREALGAECLRGHLAGVLEYRWGRLGNTVEAGGEGTGQERADGGNEGGDRQRSQAGL